MRRPFLLFAAGLSALPLVARSVPRSPTRVVVQVSDAEPARWALALNNVRNLQDALGAGRDAVEVEVVAFGPGIGVLARDGPVAAQVSEALEAGVAVSACRNTMRARKLTEADLHPGVQVVAAGVVRVVQRQQEGWAYLRP